MSKDIHFPPLRDQNFRAFSGVGRFECFFYASKQCKLWFFSIKSQIPKPQIKSKKLKFQKEYAVNQQYMFLTLSLKSHDPFIYLYLRNYLSNVYF